MTPRERWLAAIRFDEVDRLPFWPKINGSYAPAQAGRFSKMTSDELHSYIGSEPPIGIPTCVITRSDVVSTTEKRSNDEARTIIETPVGTLTSTMRYDAGSASWHPVEFPIKTREDIGIMQWAVEHTDVVVDPDRLAEAKRVQRETGDSGVTLESMEKSALMRFVEYHAGVEQAHYFLVDHEDEVAALFEAVHRSHLKRIGLILEHSPADLLMMVENTSTTLISPEQYRRFCAGQMSEYAAMFRDAGRTMVIHMCGYLNALLPQLKEVGAHAFEAFTSPPVGNTPLVAGRTACPDVCLIGGTNAALWLHPAETIIAELERDLDALPDLKGIVPSSAGVMPPAASPDTIRTVCSWIHEYSRSRAA